jgi:ornithine cyclodeaminase/alanine dehydrogenase-like protein (mu-crystallin family)
MFITSVKELEFEPKVYDDCDVLVANRRGPMWSRHVVGGAKSIPEHGDEIWYKWTQEEWEQVRLLGPIVAGIAPGRTNDQETIAFMNQGEGLQFAAVGRRLYDLAIERGLGTQAPFDWFHQGKEYGPGGGIRQTVAKLS